VKGGILVGTNRRLALLALLLAAGALFADVAPDRLLTVHEKELATAIERRQDHVTPAELASWIIEGRADYRLVDLRDAGSYARYHIPTAENVPLALLPEASLARNEKIVLYSDGGIHAAQGWMLLRASGYPGSYTLLGGLEAWQDEVLFPTLPEEPEAAERAAFEASVARARFFGGSARSGAGEATRAEAPPLPQIEAPAAPATSMPRRKKKEGC